MHGGDVAFRLGYRPPLDGLRAVAVLLVMLCHAQVAWFDAGYIGVDVFFVLSGFLITSLLVEELDRSDRLNLPAFWMRRALRLLPAVVVLVAVVSVFASALPDGTREGALPTLFYYSNWHTAAGGLTGGLRHTWSLAIEEQFYLVWPVVLYGLWRIDKRLRVAGWFCVCAIAAAVIGRTVAAQRTPIELLDRWYFNSFYRADGLLAGCLLAIVLHRGGVRRWMRDPHLLTLAGMLLVALLVVGGHWDLDDGSRFALANYHTAATALTVLAVAAVCAGGTVGMLEHPAALWIGRRSYGLYLWHLPIMWSDQFAHKHDVIWMFAASFLAAGLSYRYVEAPFLRLKDRIRSGGVMAEEPRLVQFGEGLRRAG